MQFFKKIMALLFSREKYTVFVLDGDKISDIVVPKVKVDTKILPVQELTGSQLKELKKEQGRAAVFYLRFRYGSPDTYILLAYVEGALAHVEWIIPAKKIRGRYPFVPEDSYSYASGMTPQRFRRLQIFSAQLQKPVLSGVPAKKIWLWAAITNTPSSNGIRKAGAIKVGEFVQRKWFGGCISRIKYFAEGSDSE